MSKKKQKLELEKMIAEVKTAKRIAKKAKWELKSAEYNARIKELIFWSMITSLILGLLFNVVI